MISSQTGYRSNYPENPYGDYADPDNPNLVIPMPIDGRRPPKELVFGLPRGGDGGIAFPFTELARKERRVIAEAHQGRPVAVLWSRQGEAAAAYYTDSGGGATLEVADDGFRDRETGSRWTVMGTASEGPRRGEILEQVGEAFVAFWFAWAAFQPEIVVWIP